MSKIAFAGPRDDSFGIRTMSDGVARALVATSVVVFAAACGVLAGGHPGSIRFLFAIAVSVLLVATFEISPRAGLWLLLAALPFLAVGRRMLIPVSGWPTLDPLLLVAPACALLLAVRLYLLDGRRIADNALSYLAAGLLVFSVLQAANPKNGSIVAGVTGLLFVGIPLVWLFVGRELLTRRAVSVLFWIFIATSAAAALYGVLQTEFGLPSWDQLWVDINGYTALNVGGVTRAFGTFSSSAEYALSLGAAIAVCGAYAMHGRPLALLPVPLLASALVLSAVRSAVVLCVLGLMVIASMRFVAPRLLPAALIVALVLAFAAAPKLSSALGGAAVASNNPLLQHQLGGLSNPLQEDNSTLMLHLELMTDGFKRGVADPVGSGIGVTNQASTAYRSDQGAAAQGGNTEVDVSNSFVSLGLIGGLMYAAFVLLAFATAARRYLRARGPETLAVLALITATAGQWLIGGHYALTPLIWLMLGWTAASAWRGSREEIA